MWFASWLVLNYLVTCAATHGHGGLRHLSSGGHSVKVYAPHAWAVSITGSFDGWIPDAHRLTWSGGGWWEGNITSAAGTNLLYPSAPYKIEMNTGQHGENTVWRGDPWSRQQNGVTMGNSMVYDDNHFKWTDHDFVMPDWNQLVIYELHVGTFGRQSGESDVATLDMCIQKLDHLVELGINAIELMPVAEFDGDADWGYTSAYLYAVEHAYGGPDAFKRFVNACHARGIAVLLDVVYNHLGPMDLPIWQFDGWSANNLGGIYFYNDERAQTPWAHTRPNYGQEHVRDYLLDNAAFWLDTMHCDGLRVDGVSFIRLWGGDLGRAGAVFNPEGESFLKSLTGSAVSRQKLLIAEDLQSNATLTADIQDDGLGFDSQWDNRFAYDVRNLVSKQHDESLNMSSLKGSILADLGGGLRRTVYVESHDTASHGRLPAKISAEPTAVSRKLTALATAIVMTTPGIPMLFQGQELFLQETFSASTPMDWTKRHSEAGVFALHRDLVKLRRNLQGKSKGLTGSGVSISTNESSKVLVMSRWDQHGTGDDVLVAFNFGAQSVSNAPLEFPAHGTWELAFNSDSSAYWNEATSAVPETVVAHLSDDGNVRGSTMLPPYACVIYVRAQPRLLQSVEGIDSSVGNFLGFNWLLHLVALAMFQI